MAHVTSHILNPQNKNIIQMKKLKNKLVNILLLLTFLCAGCKSNAQINCSLGAGYNFNKHPIYSLNAGYEIERVNINGGFIRSLTRSTSSTIIAGAEVGYNLLSAGDSYLLAHSIIVSAGYWHVSENSDQKANLSHWRPSLSLRYIKMLSDIGGLYANAMYVSNNFTITAGMIIKIN